MHSITHFHTFFAPLFVYNLSSRCRSKNSFHEEYKKVFPAFFIFMSVQVLALGSHSTRHWRTTRDCSSRLILAQMHQRISSSVVLKFFVAHFHAFLAAGLDKQAVSDILTDTLPLKLERDEVRKQVVLFFDKCCCRHIIFFLIWPVCSFQVVDSKCCSLLPFQPPYSRDQRLRQRTIWCDTKSVQLRYLNGRIYAFLASLATLAVQTVDTALVRDGMVALAFLEWLWKSHSELEMSRSSSLWTYCELNLLSTNHHDSFMVGIIPPAIGTASYEHYY